MSTLSTELEQFRRFAEEKLANGGASLSLEEVLRQFRAQTHSPESTPKSDGTEWTDEKNQRRADLVDKKF